jgi:hypothetical protein
MLNKATGVCFLMVMLIFSACTNVKGPVQTKVPSMTDTPTPIVKETVKPQLNTPKVVTVPDQTANVSSLSDRKLTLSILPTDDGFQVTHGNEPDFHVMQTVAAPDGKSVIQIVRRLDTSGTSNWYRRDAVVITPETKELHIYPLMNALVTDGYSVDSIVNTVGFSDEQHLIFIAVHGDAETKQVFYTIEALNVLTGQKEILFDHQPQNVQPDFYAQQWLNRKGDLLVVQSYKNGTIWVYDLKSKTVRTLKEKYPNRWPTLSVFPSPDGELFWYDGKLFNLQEKKLANMEKGNQLTQYPPFQWRQDSVYSIYHYTFDDNSNNIIGGEETTIIAPQGFKVINRQGEIVRKIEVEKGSPWRLELEGWILGEELAIIHYYQLERKSENNSPNIIKSQYKVLDMKTGVVTPLQPTSSIEAIDQPFWLQSSGLSNPSQQKLIAFDSNHNLYWSFEKQVEPLNVKSFSRYWSFEKQLNDKSSSRYWVQYDNSNGTVSLFHYASQTHKLRQIFLNKAQNPVMVIGDRWVIDTGMHYFDLAPNR